MSPNSPSQGQQPGQEALPSFDMLYDRYHMQVYRYLHAHLRHEQDAADLLQQVFFQAWKLGHLHDIRQSLLTQVHFVSS